MPTTADWQGLRLADRYLITDLLGEGGMGQVYCAQDVRLDRPVVIKVPRRAMLDVPAFAERFDQEIRSLVALQHPHVVSVLDAGVHESMPFAVMQFLSGGSLEDRRPTSAGQVLPMAPAEVAGCWGDIAAALDFIHKQGCVHRDIKPDNVLFDADANAFLSDFGVAKVVTSLSGVQDKQLTGTGLVLGTPDYMAPELIMGRDVDGRVDQYALGVMTYELISGRPPFNGATPTAVLVQHTSKDAPPLAEVAPGVPSTVSDAVRRAMAKDPAERFDTCSEFVVAFRQDLEGSSPAASAPQPALKAATLACPNSGCGAPLTLDSRYAGKRGRCKACGITVYISRDLTRVSEQPFSTTANASRHTETAGHPNPRRRVTRPERPQTRAEAARPSGPRRRMIIAVAAPVVAALVATAFAVFLLVGREDEPPTAPEAENEIQLAAPATLSSAPPTEVVSQLEKPPPPTAAPEDRIARGQSGQELGFAHALMQEVNLPPLGSDAHVLLGQIKGVAQPHELDLRVGAPTGVSSGIEARLHVGPASESDPVWPLLVQTTELGSESTVEIGSYFLEGDELAFRWVSDFAGVTEPDFNDFMLTVSHDSQKHSTRMTTSGWTRIDFSSLPSSAELPSPLAGTEAIDLGNLREVNRPQQLKWVVLRSQDNSQTKLFEAGGTDAGSGDPLDILPDVLTLADGKVANDVVFWPLVLQSPDLAAEMGYFFVQEDTLRFRWSQERGTRFFPELTRFAVRLTSGNDAHSMELRQVMRHEPIPIDFTLNRQEVAYPMPLSLPSDLPVHLQVTGIAGFAEGGQFPVTIAAGQDAKVFLHESKTLYLECSFEITDEGVEIVSRTMFDDGDRPRPMSLESLESIAKRQAATYRKNEAKLRSANVEFENNKSEIRDLETRISRLPNNARANTERIRLTTLLSKLRIKQTNLPKTGRRLTESLQRLGATIKNVNALGTFMQQSQGSIGYRIYAETDFGEVDLVLATHAQHRETALN